MENFKNKISIFEFRNYHWKYSRARLFRLFYKSSTSYRPSKKLIIVLFCTLFFANKLLADYTISAGTSVDPATTPALRSATGTISIYGTMAINSDVTFTSTTPLTILVYGPSGQIYWYANKTLAIPAGSTITYVNNPTAPPGLQPTSGNASQILQIGGVKYASTSDNSNNVVFSFVQLNSIGGTPRVHATTSTPSVCYGSSASLSTTEVLPAGVSYYFQWSSSPSGGNFSNNATASANTTSSNLSVGSDTVICGLYANTGGTNYYIVTSDTVFLTVKQTPVAPTASVTAQPTCTLATGTITISAPTGSGLTYSTDGTNYGNTNGVFNNMSAGTYNLTAKNSIGCISPATSVTVNAQPPIPAAPTASVTAQPTCTVSTGTITISAPNGSGLTYSTDGTTYSNTTGLFSNMSAGTYNLTAKNSSGCISAATSITVNAQPPTPAAPTISVTQPTCTVATGTITITVPTGPGLTYSTNGTTYTNTNGVFSNMSMGTYSLTAKNGSGCISPVTSITVNAQPPTPAAPSASVTAQPTCTLATGTITVTAPTGSGFTYSTDGATYTNTTGVFNNMSTGTYSLTAKNGSGCVSPGTNITVNAPPPIPSAPTASVTAQPTCTLATGTITITAPAGSGLTYSTDGITYTNTTGIYNAVPAGTYNLTVKNSSGCISPATSVTVNAQPPTPNISQIPISGLIASYAFSGNANDTTNNDNGTLQNSPTLSADRFNNLNKAFGFNGNNQYVSTAKAYVNPTDFTISTWFKTNTTSGGRLIGFGNAQTGQSSTYDRQIYMSNTGQIYFGVAPSSNVTVNSTLSYNDNKWHLVTASLSSASGMSLYIDGVLIGSNPGTTTAQNYTGYWKIGYDNLSGWNSAPSGYYFNGILDDIQIYNRALSGAEIKTLYQSPDGAGNNGPVCAGSSISFSASTVSNVTYSWTGPNSFSSSVQNPSLIFTPLNEGVYTLTVTSSGGCSVSAYTNVVSNGITGQWTGNIDNNWNNANNWCNGILPDISTNVTIPGSVTNMPVVVDHQFCDDILINTGATLNVNNSGTLEIAGNINNNGTFSAISGTIEMKSALAQTIPANTFLNNSLNNLIISNTNASGVSLGGPLDIYGSLTYSGTGMLFTTNDNLTLKSTSTGTARVGDMTGNTITGNVTVERYISNYKAWWFLSIPTNTTQTIRQSWQEGASSSSSNPVPGFGIQITGAGGTAAGFDAYSSNPAMKKYDTTSTATTHNWIGVPTTTSTNIKNSSGYMVFIRGDRTVTSNSGSSSTVLRTKGNLYVGDMPAYSVGADKFVSFGNPYASPIDMRNINKTGIKDFFYLWDPALSGATGFGGYQTFSNDGNGNYVVTPGGGSYGSSGSISNYIGSGQAFFVQASSSGGSLNFKESAKTSGSVGSIPLTLPQPQLRVNLYSVNKDNSTYLSDGFLINYADNYNNGVDSMDAFKSSNSSENLSVKTANKLLVIERRHTIAFQDTIYCNLANVSVKKYRFEIIANALYRPGLAGYFIDNYLHTSTPINIDGTTTIDFNIANIPASYASNRFQIVFSQLQTLPLTVSSLKANLKANMVHVDWKVENQMNIKRYEVEKSADGNNFSKVATVKANNNVTTSYSWIDELPARGYNYYRIRVVDINGKATYTEIVKVQEGPGVNSEITIFPNPVINGAMNLQLTNQPTGAYHIRIINQLGKLVFDQSIMHEGNNPERIQLNNTLSHGVYQVEITNPDKNINMLKIIY